VDGKVADPTAAVTAVAVRSNMEITANFRAAPGAQGTLIDKRDGQKYRTAQNMNYKINSSWCYNDSDSYCKKYGRLYDWNTANKACPAGWHLPSRSEWDALVNAAGGDYGDNDKPEIETVFVKGGTFRMGCVNAKGNDCYKEEPSHNVTLGDFYIGKYEVTQKQWRQLMESNPSGGVEGGDWFGEYADNDQVNPTGPPTGDARTGRGCYWGSEAIISQLYHRGFYPPGGSSYDTGFRLVLVP